MSNTYATPTLMLTTYGAQLYDLLGLDQDDAGFATNARLLQAVEAANSQVDSSLLNRYALPLSSVPAKIESVACELARWELLKARPDVEGEKDKSRKDEAEGWLKAIAVGTLRLEVGAGESFVGGAKSVEVGSTTERETACSPDWVGTF